ncbi:MAG: hypothetical protein WCT52_02360 [Candidatus Micrarchaeia archaeon]|jgi:hypothetical protein
MEKKRWIQLAVGVLAAIIIYFSQTWIIGLETKGELNLPILFIRSVAFCAIVFFAAWLIIWAEKQ